LFAKTKPQFIITMALHYKLRSTRRHN